MKDRGRSDWRPTRLIAMTVIGVAVVAVAVVGVAVAVVGVVVLSANAAQVPVELLGLGRRHSVVLVSMHL